MYIKNKNPNVKARNLQKAGNLQNEKSSFENKEMLILKVYCPRCVGFNVRKQGLLISKYICNNCGYKWR